MIFSPDNLKKFFDASVQLVNQKAVPTYGIIQNPPQFLFDTKEKEDQNYHIDLHNIMEWR